MGGVSLHCGIETITEGQHAIHPDQAFALTLGCSLLAATVIGGAGILNAQRVIDEDSAKVMNLTCSAKALETNALLSRIEQSVRTPAIYTTGQLESAARLKYDPAYLKNYTQRLETVAVNAAGNTEGAVAVYVRFNPEFTAPTSGLFWSKTSLDDNFRPLTPTDFSGFNTADTEHLGWYYIPVKNGKGTCMAPYLNKNINMKMISFVIPIYMGYETVGVVGMDINFSVITDVVKGMSVYHSGYAFLASNDSKVMFHRELDDNTPPAAADSSLRPMAAELFNGTSSSSLFPNTFRDIEKKMAFRTLNNGMRMALAAPVAEIDAAKNSLVLQISLAVAVISALSLLLTVLMTHRLVRPLRELNAAARKIAAGDLSINVMAGPKDEVGMLPESFQKTVEHLQKYISYINGLAYRDALTGVKNKTAYTNAEARLDEQIRLGRPEFALAVLGINGLKIINDTLGHDFGDMLIINACRIICKSFQHSPVFRVGGDEFVVIIEKEDYTRYSELLEDFEREVAEHNRNVPQDRQIAVAGGIAVYNSDTNLIVADAFKRADEAMYQNKAAMKRQAAARV